MKILDPTRFRICEGARSVLCSAITITRDNVDALLDAKFIEACVHKSNNRWWTIRRNGKTQTWKKNANRVRIPIKAGFDACSAITEADFIENTE